MEQHSDPTKRLRDLCSRQVRLGWRASDGILLKEYVRRLAHLEEDTNIRVSGLFFDPAELPEVDAKQSKSDQDDLTPITASIQNGYMVKLLQNFVLWKTLEQNGHRIASVHADLFDPIVKMCERGAAFTMHHGDAIFDGFSVPLQNWREAVRRKPFDISDGALSAWDAKGRGSGQ